MRPLTFEEGEALALWLDRKADREDARALAPYSPQARAQARREAEQYRRCVELIGWMSQRAPDLHQLQIPRTYQRSRA